MTSNRPPSQGERAAIIGYHAQYTIAADLIYSALLQDKLEWIKVADPEAGRVDDIQIATAGSIDAYQVKWGEKPKTFSFKGLTKGNPNLIHQLADGWFKLKQANPGYRITVHFITCDKPAPRANIPYDGNSDLKPKLKKFLVDCWRDRLWAKNGIEFAPQNWQIAIHEIKNASQLDEDNFLEFVQSCELEFSYELPTKKLREQYRGRAENQRLVFIDKLENFLFRTVGEDHKTVELKKDELLNRLDWDNQFKQRFVHKFPVDGLLYQPIVSTVSEIEESLNQFQQGYLALIGTPGSGKSTTLAQTLRNKPDFRVIHYFSYIPKSYDQGRGEAYFFLHDLYVKLREHRIFGSLQSHPSSREDFIQRFNEQLIELGEKWQSKKNLTIILVDGLDHIEREQSPERSLIEDLPHPETIPEGVLFILGTQTLNLKGMSDAIKTHLDEKGRTIKIQQLERDDVYEIINRSDIPEKITSAQKEKIYKLSDGHPLALIYILKRLQDNVIGIQEILNETNPYSGDINREYNIYWEKIETDQALRDLFGLIARLRIPINPQELKSWVNTDSVKKFASSARHYFHEETRDRWRFFHNSFRQFVLDKTQYDEFGYSDIQQDQDYHKRLADFSALAAPGSPQSWEELYHRAKAKDLDSVLRLGTQKGFREQFISFRSFTSIMDDIGLVLNSAKEVHEPIAILRSLLIEHELDERQKLLEQTDFLELILELKGPSHVTDYILEDRSLRIDPTKALELSFLLVQKEEMKLAEDVFKASEPLDLLSGNEQIDRIGQDDVELLMSWINVAHFFRPLNDISDVIEQLQVSDRFGGYRDGLQDITTEIKFRLWHELIDSVIDTEDDSKIETLLLFLDENSYNELLRHTNFGICNRYYKNPIATQALEKLLDETDRNELDDINKTLISEFIYRILGDTEQAKDWIDGIEQPDNYSRSTSTWGWKNLSPFIQRIRFNRLLSALGEPQDPVGAVSNNEDGSYHEFVLFERNLVVIANLWGKAWSGQSSSPSEVVRELYPAFTFFERTHENSSDISSRIEVQGSALDFFDLLIRAAAEHGDAVIQAIGEEFQNRWYNQSDGKFWPHSWKLHLARTLYKYGDYKEKFKHRLEILETEIGILDDVNSRLEALTNLSKAWIEIGDEEKSKSFFSQIIEGSFSINDEEDYQFSRWVDWLCKVSESNPHSFIEDIRHFCGTLAVLEESGRGSELQESAIKILSLVGKWNPGYAIELCSWLLDNHAIYYSSMLEGLLSAVLKLPNPPIEVTSLITQYLLIPFASIVPTEFIKKLSESFNRIQNNHIRDLLLEGLSISIETKSLPSNRLEYWQYIVLGLNKAGIEAESIEQRLSATPEKNDGITRPTITLESGETLSTEKIKLRVQSYSGLLDLLNDLEDSTYFHWEQILEPLIETLDIDQIHELQRQFSRINSGKIIFSLLAKRLGKLGKQDEALNILTSLLDESSPRGWHRRWDGGSRLEVVKSLVQLYPQEWREKALGLFAHDYLYEYRYPNYLLDNLEEIVQIIFEDPPLDDLWIEIKEHIYKISDFSNTKNFPPHLSSDNTPFSHIDMLLKCLTISMDIPINDIREGVHRALYQIAIHDPNNDSLRKALEDLLVGTDSHCFQALALFDVVQFICPEIISSLSEKIAELCSSPNFMIRETALRLAHEHDIIPSLPSSNRNTLPQTYYIHFEPFVSMEGLFPLEIMQQDESLPKINDPKKMNLPNSEIINALNCFSGIPKENLLYRASNLMHTIIHENEWNENAERKLMNRLNSLGLKFPWYLLRPQVELLSIYYVISEMLDAEAITEQQIDMIMQFLKRHDKYLSVQSPVKKPEVIEVPSFYNSTRISSNEWLENIEEASSSIIINIDNDFTILGEITYFHSLDFEKPVESRLSALCHKSYSVDQLTDNMFWFAQDYPDFPLEVDYSIVVILVYQKQIELGSARWLALNPTIAKQLGWSLDQEGLFRWVNSQNEIMVESIWWQDGPINLKSQRYNETCGEGWLVKATNNAAKMIFELIGDTIRVIKITREYNDQETGKKENSFVAIDP